MLRCKELTEVATDYLEGDLSRMERLRVRIHLWMCRHCRTYLDQMRKVVELLRQLPKENAPFEVLDELLPRFKDSRP
jgi:predicted anti-sigma-YlaC factor YlaD